MARKAQHETVLETLRRSDNALSVAELINLVEPGLPQRTLRRWLSEMLKLGVVKRQGVGRSTRYRYIGDVENPAFPSPDALGFLQNLDNDLKQQLLGQIRDLWTHTSTALEGNTLSLGDTHFLLQDGLTISGKSIRDHEEIIGHSRAIDLLYQCLRKPLTEKLVFQLHNAVQTEHVTDIFKPNGAWKKEPNGTHIVASDGRQIFIEYAMPSMVPALMTEIIEFTNSANLNTVTETTAHEFYAKIHMGIVHVHPFWDGNGRIARLLANIPLLRAGLPPITIPADKRRDYLQTLADYQLDIGQLDNETGVWPDDSQLLPFGHFCKECYESMQMLLTAAFDVQKRRELA